MSKPKDKASQRPLTPKEQLRNLVEGLCEKPFYVDLPADSDFDYPLAKTKQRLIDQAKASATVQIDDFLTDFLAKHSPETSVTIQQNQSGSSNWSGPDRRYEKKPRRRKKVDPQKMRKPS